MIPDKIYIGTVTLSNNAPSEECLLPDWHLRPNPKVANVEYIRKDDLMNYFHKRVEELNSPLNGVFGSTEREHCNERISELLLLIDKLNSM